MGYFAYILRHVRPGSAGRHEDPAASWVGALSPTAPRQDPDLTVQWVRLAIASAHPRPPMPTTRRLGQTQPIALGMSLTDGIVPRGQAGPTAVNERLNRGSARRTDVVDIFHDGRSIIRPVRAILAEQQDEWVEGPLPLTRRPPPAPKPSTPSNKK